MSDQPDRGLYDAAHAWRRSVRCLILQGLAIQGEVGRGFLTGKADSPSVAASGPGGFFRRDVNRNFQIVVFGERL
jgi:hypothetical protein